MNKFHSRLSEYVQSIDAALPCYLPDAQSLDVAEAMSYSLLGGGKRIRGVLLLATYQMFAPDVAPALPMACALEMIHAYSLIHDDLPCMDDDDMRRGKPACHIAFGEATALLAGDGLLTRGFEVLCDERAAEFFGSSRILGCVRALAKAAGVDGMIGGQSMDLANEGQQVSLERLAETDAKKTGALFVASAQMGCILAGATAQQTQAVVDYAADVGVVFQIVDDILDVTADMQKLGKPVHSDAVNNKQTYVTLLGMEQAKEAVALRSSRAKERLQSAGLDADFLCSLADELCAREF